MSERDGKEPGRKGGREIENIVCGLRGRGREGGKKKQGEREEERTLKSNPNMAEHPT